jgi:hypothetical protein
MRTYILGYNFDDVLTEFSSEYDADYNSSEWVAIEAYSLNHAKSIYEEQFANWQSQTIGV